MPMPIGPLLHILSGDPVLWTAAATALLVFWILAIRGLLATLGSINRRIAAWRRTRSDKRTTTIAQIRTSSDYGAATTAERAALERLDPATELVHAARFQGHSAAVDREIVGHERCAQWPYRQIDLEEAAEYLRASCASIRIGGSTYYYRVPVPDDPKTDLQCLRR